MLEFFTFSETPADAPTSKISEVDFERLRRQNCSKKLTQDTDKVFKEPFSSLVSSFSVTFPFKWIFFSRVIQAAKMDASSCFQHFQTTSHRPNSSSVGKPLCGISGHLSFTRTILQKMHQTTEQEDWRLISTSIMSDRQTAALIHIQKGLRGTNQAKKRSCWKNGQNSSQMGLESNSSHGTPLMGHCRRSLCPNLSRRKTA